MKISVKNMHKQVNGPKATVLPIIAVRPLDLCRSWGEFFGDIAVGAAIRIGFFFRCVSHDPTGSVVLWYGNLKQKIAKFFYESLAFWQNNG